MDDDMILRRLRPPPVPVQPTPPGPPSGDEEPYPELFDWMAPQPRDDVPWDRPDDYQAPTDSASPDQPAWDKPSAGASDPYGAAPDWPTWPPPEANPQVALARGQPGQAFASPPAPSSDPDDALAPILGDLSPAVSRAWPEMNGHDSSRLDATVAGSTGSIPPEPPPGEWAGIAQPRPETPSVGSPSRPPTPATEPVFVADVSLPPGASAAASQPLVVRIELAIVDDSRRLARPAQADSRVDEDPPQTSPSDSVQQTSWLHALDQPSAIPPATPLAPWASSPDPLAQLSALPSQPMAAQATPDDGDIALGTSSSSLKVAIATVFMAVVVIALFLAFAVLLTSILR